MEIHLAKSLNLEMLIYAMDAYMFVFVLEWFSTMQC